MGTKSESSFFSVTPESAVQLCFTKYLLSIYYSENSFPHKTFYFLLVRTHTVGPEQNIEFLLARISRLPQQLHSLPVTTISFGYLEVNFVTTTVWIKTLTVFQLGKTTPPGPLLQLWSDATRCWLPPATHRKQKHTQHRERYSDNIRCLTACPEEMHSGPFYGKRNLFVLFLHFCTFLIENRSRKHWKIKFKFQFQSGHC